MDERHLEDLKQVLFDGLRARADAELARGGRERERNEEGTT
jgi:hypothetical protein